MVNQNNCVVLIGPEGDFSEDEIKLASANGFLSVSLSKSRLRTETAALVALVSLHLRNE
jgi:16S rRNA (uracil1498-N3)-methyltransferase